MQEIWKDIENYEGLYQISNFGRVRSLNHFRKNGTGIYLHKGKILIPQNANGYCFVRLSKNGKSKQYLLHRLVAQAFLPKLEKYNEINHKDENKRNNHINNLEWCSHKYNINYGTGNERRKTSEQGKKKTWNTQKVGGNNKKIKPVKKYDLQGNFIKEWNSIAEASRQLKLNKIWEVCNNKRNKCGNFIWKYKKEEDALCL